PWPGPRASARRIPKSAARPSPSWPSGAGRPPRNSPPSPTAWAPAAKWWSARRPRRSLRSRRAAPRSRTCSLPLSRRRSRAGAGARPSRSRSWATRRRRRSPSCSRRSATTTATCAGRRRRAERAGAGGAARGERQRRPLAPARGGGGAPPARGRVISVDARVRVPVAARPGGLEGEPARSGVHDQPVAVADLPRDELLRQRGLDRALHDALERPGAVDRVEPALGEEVLGLVGEHELEVAVGEPGLEPRELDVDDLPQVGARQRVEDHHVVDAVQELG